MLNLRGYCRLRFPQQMPARLFFRCFCFVLSAPNGPSLLHQPRAISLQGYFLNDFRVFCFEHPTQEGKRV